MDIVINHETMWGGITVTEQWSDSLRWRGVDFFIAAADGAEEHVGSDYPSQDQIRAFRDAVSVPMFNT